MRLFGAPAARRGGALLRAILVVLSSLAGLVIALALAEVALRVLDPVKPRPLEHPFVNQYVRLEHPRNFTHEISPPAGMPGIDETIRFSTNAYGFRGGELQVPKPAGEFRIFAVGGSTTECSIIDDRNAYPAVVERELARLADAGRTIRVHNTAVSGASSDDHVAMIGQRLVHLEPDLIIVFAGINDLTDSIVESDPLHYTRPLPRGRSRRLLELRSVAILWRALAGAPEREVQERVYGFYEKLALQAAHPEVADLPRVDLEPYETNLRTLAGMSRVHGFQLVFMTQQSTWNSPTDPRTKEFHHMRYRGGKTYAEAPMDAALEQFNDLMRGIAGELEVPLYDLAREVPKSLEFFYDDCHFNTPGSIAAGKNVARFLREQELVPVAASTH